MIGHRLKDLCALALLLQIQGMTVHAAAGKSCLSAGYVRSTVMMNGREVCPLPVDPNCSAGTSPCNPAIFGNDVKTMGPYCLPSGMASTPECARVSGNSAYTAALFLKDKVPWDQEVKKVETHCLSKMRPTERVACEVVLKQVEMARFGDRKRETSNCKEMPRFSSPSAAKVILTEASPKKYVAHLNLKFTGPNSQGMKDWAQACLNQAAPYLKGPNGETLSVKIGGEKASLLPVREVAVSAPGTRSVSVAWRSDIPCSTVAHEVMHLLGLKDEYHEEWSGYRVKVEPEAVKIAGIVEVNLPKVVAQRVERDAQYADSDCRILGPRDGLMAFDDMAFESVKNGTRKSLLEPGQFYKVVFPDCSALNKTYDECSKYSQITTEWYLRGNVETQVRTCADKAKTSPEHYNKCEYLERGAQWLSGKSWDSIGPITVHSGESGKTNGREE